MLCAGRAAENELFGTDFDAGAQFLGKFDVFCAIFHLARASANHIAAIFVFSDAGFGLFIADLREIGQ